jgi:hypothetical protein
VWILNPISRDKSVFRSSENKHSRSHNLQHPYLLQLHAAILTINKRQTAFSWKFAQSCINHYSVVQGHVTVCTTSAQSYCPLPYEDFTCKERESLCDRFFYKLLGHWCVWLLENMSYNYKWLRRALSLPLWNGTIHKRLSLYINIYRYKANIIKKFINTVHKRMTAHCVKVSSIQLEQIFILECIIGYSSLANMGE